MARPTPDDRPADVIRSPFHFYECAGVVEIYYGARADPESEYVGRFSASFIPQIVAGLQALRLRAPAVPLRKRRAT